MKKRKLYSIFKSVRKRGKDNDTVSAESKANSNMQPLPPPPILNQPKIKKTRTKPTQPKLVIANYPKISTHFMPLTKQMITNTLAPPPITGDEMKLPKL